MIIKVWCQMAEILLFLRILAVCSTTRNSRTPFRLTTRSVCLPWSRRAELEELGRSVPDPTSEVDIWEDWMRMVLLLRMPKSPRISTPCLIGKGLYCKGRSAPEIGPDRYVRSPYFLTHNSPLPVKSLLTVANAVNDTSIDSL
jgi:hypothetical protein